MKTVDEVLDMMHTRIDRAMLEKYIERNWLRPVTADSGWVFEDIDIARLELVCHLTMDIQVNDDGMDVLLLVLDQLYDARTHMKHLAHAITHQPAEIQTEIWALVKKSAAH